MDVFFFLKIIIEGLYDVCLKKIVRILDVNVYRRVSFFFILEWGMDSRNEEVCDFDLLVEKWLNFILFLFYLSDNLSTGN